MNPPSAGPETPTVAARVRGFIRQHAYVLIVCLLLAVAAYLRIARLRDPMRFDESYTFLYFIAQDEPWRVFKEYNPNNHVLLTLLMSACYWVGSMDPAVIRTPTLLIGLGIVVAAAELARRMSGLLAAFVAGSLVATSGILVEYSVNARGYGPVTLMALLMAICTHRILQTPRPWAPWICWALTAAIGAYFMPIMLYPAVFFLLVIIVQTRAAWGSAPYVHVIGTVGASVAVTAFLYTPIIYFNGWRSLLANKWIAPRPISDVLSGLPLTAWQALQHWVLDASWPWMAVVAAGLLASVALGIRRRILLPCAPLLLPAVVYVVSLGQRVIPYPRVLLFILPLLLVCAAVGLAGLSSSVGRASHGLAGALLVILVVVVAADAGRRTAAEPYLISEDPAVMVDAESIVRDAVAGKLNNERTALVWDERVPTWPPLAYYMCLHCPPGEYFANYQNPSCEQALLVVGCGQTVERLCVDTSKLSELYAAPNVWHTYPRATVYLAQRNTKR